MSLTAVRAFFTIAVCATVVFAVAADSTLQVAMVTIEPSSVVFNSQNYSNSIRMMTLSCQLSNDASASGSVGVGVGVGEAEQTATASIVGRHLILRRSGRWHVEPYEDMGTGTGTGTGTGQPLFDLQTDAMILFIRLSSSGNTPDTLRLVFVANQEISATATLYLQKEAPSADGLANVSRFSMVRPLVGRVGETIGVLKTSVLYVSDVDRKRWPPKSATFDESLTRPSRIFEFGHRGCGNSFEMAIRQNFINAFVPENTVASIKYASRFTDLIELDVQVGNVDRVPFLSHYLQPNPTTAPIGATVRPPVCNHSGDGYDGNSNSQGQHQGNVDVNMPLTDSEESCVIRVPTLHKVALSPADPIPSDFSATSEELRGYPKLQTVLDAIDPSIAFNIEFKYPLNPKTGVQTVVGFMDRNEYVDAILKVLIEDAEKRESRGEQRRRISVGSFDGDICVLLNLKQSRFPVFFIGPGIQTADWRHSDANIGTAFAASTNLNGVFLDSLSLPRFNLYALADFVTFAKSQKLVVWTWGTDSDDAVSRQIQMNAGVDAACVNRIYAAKRTPVVYRRP